MIVSEDTAIIEVGMFGSSYVLIDKRDKYDFLLENNTIGGDIAEWSTVNGFCSFFTGGDGAYFILGLKSKSISVMVHEAIHLSHFIMDYKGIPISCNNTEIEAYLVQSIIENLMAHYDSKKNLQKKGKK